MTIRYRAAAAALAAAFGLSSVSALADVITFDGVSPGPASHTVPSPYVEGIYSISAPHGLYYLGAADPRYSGENNLFDSNYDDVTTLTTTNGEAFDIKSIDLAEMYLGSAPSEEPTTFTGTTTGGTTVIETFDVDNVGAFATDSFSSGFSDLTSLSWASTGYTPQFANIVLSPVPEPGAWAMLMLGVFGLGAMLRIGRKGNDVGDDEPRAMMPIGDRRVV